MTRRRAVKAIGSSILTAKYLHGADTRLVVYEGDSITSGSVTGFVAYPATVTSHFAPALTWSNNAVSGSTVATMVSRGAAVDALFAGNPGPNVLSILIGVNNASGGFNASQFIAALKPYCQTRKSNTPGLKIMIIPLTACASVEATRDAYNVAINADPSFYDLSMSIVGDTHIWQDGNSANTTYFVDGVHPTVLSQTTIIPPFVEAGLQTFFGTGGIGMSGPISTGSGIRLQ